MKNTQRGSMSVILLVTIVVVLLGIIGYLYLKPTQQQVSESISQTASDQLITSDQVQTVPKADPIIQTTSGTEKASGIIKLVYSKSGKNYIDVDYIELNSNWAPGGMSGPAYQNDNSKIRTFEVSSSAKFIVGSPATNSVSFSEFQKFFTTSDTSYQKNNPWDIIIVNGVVTSITEHFLP